MKRPTLFFGYENGNLKFHPDAVGQLNNHEPTVLLAVEKLLECRSWIDKASLTALQGQIPDTLYSIFIAIYNKEYSNAAMTCREEAALTGNTLFICILGELIFCEKICASLDDFQCVGLTTMPHGDCYDLAAILYRHAATHGNSSAIAYLAFMIQRGVIQATLADFECMGLTAVPQDNRFDQAAILYRHAAAQGSVRAVDHLAFMIQEGYIKATETDFMCAGLTMPDGNCFERAAVLYRHAAMQGSVPAVNHLAFMIREGEIEATEADFSCVDLILPRGNRLEKAALLYRHAAMSGYASGLTNLAFLIYRKSVGVILDGFAGVSLITASQTNHFRQAAELFRLAARFGDSGATFNLASMIFSAKTQAIIDDFSEEGLTTLPPNRFEQAAVLYRRAAQQGCPTAMCALGSLILDKRICVRRADFDYVGLDAARFSSHSLVSAIYYFKAAREQVQHAADMFISALRHLDSRSSLICSKIITTYLMGRSRDDVPVSLFSKLVCHKKFVSSYILSAKGMEDYGKSNWETLVNTQTAFGCVINYSRNLISSNTIEPPGVTATSKKIERAYGLFSRRPARAEPAEPPFCDTAFGNHEL